MSQPWSKSSISCRRQNEVVCLTATSPFNPKPGSSWASKVSGITSPLLPLGDRTYCCTFPTCKISKPIQIYCEIEDSVKKKIQQTTTKLSFSPLIFFFSPRWNRVCCSAAESIYEEYINIYKETWVWHTLSFVKRIILPLKECSDFKVFLTSLEHNLLITTKT